jgi:hypothetical protein
MWQKQMLPIVLEAFTATQLHGLCWEREEKSLMSSFRIFGIIK